METVKERTATAEGRAHQRGGGGTEGRRRADAHAEGAVKPAPAGSSHGRLPLSPGRVMAWMVATIFVVILVTETVSRLHHESAIVEGLSHIFALAAALLPLFYFLWYRPLFQQMRERQRSESEVRDLSHRLLVAGEEERRKLARDLHDELGQKLTSLQMRLEGLGGRIAGEQPLLEQNCRQLVEMAQELGDDLRLVVADLRPNLLEELGIGSALEVYFGELREQCPEMAIQFTCSGLRERPGAEVETVLYRVAQEALTNILKHAEARQVTVRLAASYPRIILGVQDDGRGFDQRQKKRAGKLSGYGLVGMRERVAALGGEIDIASRPGKGTRIRVELPLVLGEGP